MELAAVLGTAKSGSLIVAAIASVFTIGYIANLPGENEDWLHELSIDMFPEDGSTKRRESSSEETLHRCHSLENSSSRIRPGPA